MKLVVILSALKGNVENILKNLNLQSDCIFVSQCDKEGEEFFYFGEHRIFLINSTTIGLSKSRNIGLKKAYNLGYDVGVLCDDDVTYYHGYNHYITSLYKKNPSIDAIGFKIKRYDSSVI